VTGGDAATLRIAMNVEKVRRWHWVVLGLMVGLALGYAHAALAPGDLFSSASTISQADFEAAVAAEPQGGHPIVRDITVRPEPRFHRVTLRRFERVSDHVARVKGADAAADIDPNAWKYYDYTLTARVPYRKAGPPSNTVLDYLADMKKSRGLRYRVAWWNRPSVAVTLWAAGCTILIGGVWPTVLRLMVGTGLGRPPEPEKPAAASYAEPQPEEPLHADVPLMTDEPDTVVTTGPVLPTVAVPVAVRELTTEEVTTAPAAPADEKEYEGEYYPVARKARRDKAKA
jgi:hypothetical protein